jgi:hypothetical protein
MSPQPISIHPLPEYEMKLLNSMAFFLGRSVETQATAALAMYLRQNCDRLLTQCEFYAHKLGMDKYTLLNLITDDPQQAAALLREAGRVHRPEDGSDVFDP